MDKPLYKLAQENKLPKHQFIDVPTIVWMKRNRPKEIGGIKLFSIKKKYARDALALIGFLPENDWYKSERNVLGIHGLLHAYRVALFSIMINDYSKLRLNRSLLILMSISHDLGRINDKDDYDHGSAAALWLCNNKRLAEKKLGKKFKKNSALDKIIESIQMHSSTSAEIIDNPYLDVLKAADALDRYRLPKIKWWINDCFLKIKPTPEMKAFAFSLMIESETGKLAGLPLNQTIKCFLQT